MSWRALVTGHEGFIGRNLLKTLRKVGPFIEVDGLEKEYLQTENWPLRLTQLLDDKKPTHIFHVGACSNTMESDLQKLFVENFESTVIISDWCNSNGAKMIFSSSAACYGQYGDFPSNMYGWSKYCAERYVCLAGGTALRYFNVYGPGEQDKGPMASVFWQAVQEARVGRSFGLFAGNPQRDFIHVTDVVNANLCAIDLPQDGIGRRFDVGTGVAHSFEVALGHLGLEFHYRNDKPPQGYQFSTKANQANWVPNWVPDFDLISGLDQYRTAMSEDQ